MSNRSGVLKQFARALSANPPMYLSEQKRKAIDLVRTNQMIYINEIEYIQEAIDAEMEDNECTQLHMWAKNRRGGCARRHIRAT
jgi:hypothetical protein